MPKPKTDVTKAEDPKVDEKVGDATVTETKTETAEKTGKVDKPVKITVVEGPLTVILPNKDSRVYSYASHGEHYRTLAKQFAEAHNGTIL